MDVLRNASPNLSVMKEPRGFLRVIQLILSILAFATVCTSATTHINVQCTNKTGLSGTVAMKYSYPFNLESSVPVKTPFCEKSQHDEHPLKFNFSSAPQFFCFVGVMSFLLCLAYCVGYVMFSPLFSKNSTAATVDFVFTIVWTLIWFIANVAWADKLNAMGSYLDPKELRQDVLNGLNYCGKQFVKCDDGAAGNHATLVVSVLFGFLNMLVWGVGLWFLFKETRWHQEQGGDLENIGEPAAEPKAPATGSYQAPENTAY